MTGNAEDLLIVLNLVASLFVILQIVPHNKLKDVIIAINRHNLDSKLKYLNKMNKTHIVVQIKLFKVNEKKL